MLWSRGISVVADVKEEEEAEEAERDTDVGEAACESLSEAQTPSQHSRSHIKGSRIPLAIMILLRQRQHDDHVPYEDQDGVLPLWTLLSKFCATQTM